MKLIIGLMILLSLSGTASADIGFDDIATVDVENALKLVANELGFVFSILLATVLVVVVLCIIVLIIKGASGEIFSQIETRSRAFVGIVAVLGLVLIGAIALVILISMFNKFYLS
uniref:Uncharacterized protein n=1 Tax=viral metagenome TaxID=1070528 RepID=A0A6M3MDM5_9ZZZZ